MIKHKSLGLILAVIEVSSCFFFVAVATQTFNNKDFPIWIVCVFASLYFLHQIFCAISHNTHLKILRKTADAKRQCKNSCK